MVLLDREIILIKEKLKKIDGIISNNDKRLSELEKKRLSELEKRKTKSKKT